MVSVVGPVALPEGVGGEAGDGGRLGGAQDPDTLARLHG